MTKIIETHQKEASPYLALGENNQLDPDKMSLLWNTSYAWLLQPAASLKHKNSIIQCAAGTFHNEK